MSQLAAKIRYNIISRFSTPIFTFLARHQMTTLTALLMRIHIKTFQKDKADNKSNVIHTLLLPKAGFTEDAMACFGGDDRYGIYALDRNLIKAIFKGFLPEEIDDNNYRSTDPHIEQRKSELRVFWVEVLRVLLKNLKVNVVISGNFSYAAEQEFAGALGELGVPFVAMHKECLKTPGLEPFYQEIYETRKNPFQGSKICVYNEVESRIQKAAGITSPENIVITGMSRLDLVHRHREQLSESDILSKKQPTILFFSFNTKAGLPIIGRKLPQRFETLKSNLERLDCKELSRSCHLAMLKLAQENPEIRVVIKTKGDVQSYRTLSSFFGENFDCPQNLEIMAGGDLLQILRESSVVCGFNSTVLLEAIALNKTVIIPKFYEALNPKISPYNMDLEDAVQYADTPEQLIEMLREAATNGRSMNGDSELDEAKRCLLTKWLGNSDGLAGQRVREVIEEVIGKDKTIQNVRHEI